MKPFFVAVCGLYGSKLVHVFKTLFGNSTLQLLPLRDILGQNYTFFNRDKYSSFDNTVYIYSSYEYTFRVLQSNQEICEQ